MDDINLNRYRKDFWNNFRVFISSRKFY